MATGLIIPGVQVSVVKEVLPRQLSPSGVLGLIGFVARNTSDRVERVGSWSRFVEVFGAASAYSLPEARQALDNGVFELVVSSLPVESVSVARASLPTDATGSSAFVLSARAPGTWANSLWVAIEHRVTFEGTVFDLTLTGPEGEQALLRGLRPESLAKALEGSPVKVEDNPPSSLPLAGKYPLKGGEDAGVDAYRTALRRLVNESDVDMVLAAVQDFSDIKKVSQIYGEVITHCEAMSTEARGRMGFGQVGPGHEDEKDISFFQSLINDRFVLVAPHGAVGAVAGRVGSLPYYSSPTFKRVSVSTELEPLGVEAQRTLLRRHVVPVAVERGKGLLIMKGITTDGEQINVRRVADRAVRMMKMIGDLFIGLLNNADARGALKQKLTEALVQMEKEGALVPSTDGSSPAFMVEVYSSQADFAQGIVRVGMAVRPVRAIDYIYATITVQV